MRVKMMESMATKHTETGACGGMKLEGFGVGYGERRLLRAVDAQFEAGELTALIGRNGAGKSTLLRAMAGLNPRYEGKILIAAGAPGRGASATRTWQELREMGPGEMARCLAFVNTERTRIPNLRCEDVVALGRAPYTNWIGRLEGDDRRIVSEALEAVGMGAYARRTMDTMSDGECQRVMIARALAQDTPVILLDEPTSFLDMPNRYELVALLRRLVRDSGKCVIFSTHELDIAMSLCDRVALIDSPNLRVLPTGEMKRSGYVEKLFQNDCVRFDALTGRVELIE